MPHVFTPLWQQQTSAVSDSGSRSAVSPFYCKGAARSRIDLGVQGGLREFLGKLAQSVDALFGRIAGDKRRVVGTLAYGPVRVATGTMGYKHKQADLAGVKASLAAPNFLLKVITHVDSRPRICELVEYYLEDIEVKGAWTGPAGLTLASHALAPLDELPVLEIVSATHIIADLTLGLGKVVMTI